jgi:cold shock CspA family protein
MDDVFTISRSRKVPRYVGTVVEFDERLQCGTIMPDDRDIEVFVSATQIVGGGSLYEGDRVSFVQAPCARGFLARVVRRVSEATANKEVRNA